MQGDNGAWLGSFALKQKVLRKLSNCQIQNYKRWFLTFLLHFPELEIRLATEMRANTTKRPFQVSHQTGERESSILVQPRDITVYWVDGTT